ncbi:MAG: 50S ribosomal protein L19 [Candidatus Aureabacteria bacterium]|nr:50S ribosomal protein L19 [Candidatus Auribacterota bacterium]
MNKIISEIEKSQMKKKIPPFTVGDTIKVLFKILEGDKERMQAFQGVVISRKSTGINEAVTLRRISYGEGVERVFLLHSPKVGKIEIIKTGSTGRAKLYYLRDKVGKKARLKNEQHVAGMAEEDSLVTGDIAGSGAPEPVKPEAKAPEKEKAGKE